MYLELDPRRPHLNLAREILEARWRDCHATVATATAAAASFSAATAAASGACSSAAAAAPTIAAAVRVNPSLNPSLSTCKGIRCEGGIIRPTER